MPSRREAARQEVTLILEVGSHILTTEPPHYYPRPSTPAGFHPHTSYDLLKDSVTVIPKTRHTYGTRMDTSQFHVLVYFKVRTPRLPSPSFPRSRPKLHRTASV